MCKLGNNPENADVIKIMQRVVLFALNTASDLNLNVVAMALSGFTEEHNSLWRQMVGTQSAKLQSPYLRTMFAFLTADTERYEDMLVDLYYMMF